MASSLEFARRMAKPPTTSFDSVKGPSVTLTFPFADRTRAPRALGRQPSVATSQPAFIPSSISFPILFISSCDGGAFLSTDLYMLKNFMAISWYSYFLNLVLSCSSFHHKRKYIPALLHNE